MPNCLSAELLSNKGREKLYVAPIVFLSHPGEGQGTTTPRCLAERFCPLCPRERT